MAGTNGHVNGHSNGAVEKPEVDDLSNSMEFNPGPVSKLTMKGPMFSTGFSHRSDSFGEQPFAILRDAIITTRRKLISVIDIIDEKYIDTMTFEGFLEFIEQERITSMPQRGSSWDSVLKWAEFFALQVSLYSGAVGSFVPESRTAEKLILAASRSLLELGSNNAPALVTTFGMFYELALSVSFFLRHNQLLQSTGAIRTQVSKAMSQIMQLVQGVSICYHERVSHAHFGSVAFDITATFGPQVDAFYSRKERIIDLMWEFALGDDRAAEVQLIREWLKPSDQVLRSLSKPENFLRVQRDEQTCEWFQRPLLDYSRGTNDVLCITGPQGCGKSVLHGWAAERLQRPLGRKTHVVLSHKIEFDVPSQATTLAVAKHLAAQLLESSVGDHALFSALLRAAKTAEHSNNVSAQEKELWKALDDGLDKFQSRFKDNLMILVDGLDEMHGGKAAADSLRTRLAELAAKHGRVQVILFSQDSGHLAGHKRVDELKVTPDRIHSDIRQVTHRLLKDNEHFRKRDEFDQEKQVDHLCDAAKGSYLWITLTTALLRKETSQDHFSKALKSALESPETVNELIEKTISSVDLSKHDAALKLSWLLNATRPLTLSEIGCLLQIDTSKKHLTDAHTNIGDGFKHMFGPLVTIYKNTIRIRHAAIHNYLLNLQHEGKRLPSHAKSNTDLATRLVAYCRFVLTERVEPSFDLLAPAMMHNAFESHALLGYAVRNWIVHFRMSSMHKSHDNFELSAEFKECFPHVNLLALLEWTAWTQQYYASEAAILHEIALRVRQTILGRHHEIVLQNFIICGSIYRFLTNTTKAASFFYDASVLSKTVQKYTAITVSCATAFLEITETVTSTTRTEIITHKEEVLKIVIATYKSQTTKSEEVIKYYKLLAQLYVDIHEESHAETIWRELHELIIVRYGKGSEQETSISEHLTVVLKRSDKREDVIEYEDRIFAVSRKLAIWDIKRIRLELELAVSYEARGEFFLAERIYITLWQKLNDRRQHDHGVEIYIHIIDVVIEYIRFLQRRKRHEEVKNILICIWAEFREYEFESESLFLKIKIIGEIMRSVSLFSVAISVFKKCWSWFSSRSIEKHTSSCEVLISEVTQEIIKTTVTIEKVTTTTEAVIKEIFESTLTKKTITSESITVIKTMISYYMKFERWSEATEVTRRSLSLIWKMILSSSTAILLPREHSAEAIELALQLALCHIRLSRVYEAEEIYVRLFRACRASCGIQDKRLNESIIVLIAFYEEHRSWKKLIDIHRELLKEYKHHLGVSHQLTIKTLYLLGKLCLEHGHGSALEYYQEIVVVLNGDAKFCHKDAFEAMIVLCRIHYEEGHWERLNAVCKVLWSTWTHHHLDKVFSIAIVEMLYKRYRYVLEMHIKVEYELLRSLVLEYRSTCLKVFGAEVAIYVNACIELGRICERSEKYISEAITVYEEVITKTTKTETISVTTIQTVRERLTKAYVVVCSHESVSKTTIERAIKIITERFQYVKTTYGYSHSETLIVLRELILVYAKLETKESRTIILQMLTQSCLEIIAKEKDSRCLFDAAETLGKLYVHCGLVAEGMEMLRELRWQIISKSTSTIEKYRLKEKTVGRVSFAFLVTFENILRGALTVSYAEIMAELLIETVLYQSYILALHAKEVKIREVLLQCAHLRKFLSLHYRIEQRKAIELEVFEVFITKVGASLKARREVSFTFFISLLEELDVEGLDFVTAACIAVKNETSKLLEAGKPQEAYEVAACGYQFIHEHGAFKHLENIGFGFKLSALMALRGVKRTMEVEPKLRNQMLELSTKIIHEVIKTCTDAKIDFIRLQMHELNDLVALLGLQKNYTQLEWLLKLLWQSRSSDKRLTENPELLILVGKRYVQARFLSNQKHPQQAIDLCEDINYNLSRMWGALDPKALEISDLLAQLYTTVGHYREAMSLHETLLRLVTEGDDDDDRTFDTMDSHEARKHVDLLHQSYQRLGGWDKSAHVYKEIVDALLHMPAYKGKAEWKGVESTDKWHVKGEVNDALDKFHVPDSWEILLHGPDTGSVMSPTTPGTPSSSGFLAPHKRPGHGVKRVSSNWGVSLFHRLLHNDDEDDHTNGNGHAHKSPEIYY